jgi:hypothetical protein
MFSLPPPFQRTVPVLPFLTVLLIQINLEFSLFFPLISKEILSKVIARYMRVLLGQQLLDNFARM